MSFICCLGVSNKAPCPGAPTTEAYCLHPGSRASGRIVLMAMGEGPVPVFSPWFTDGFVLCVSRRPLALRVCIPKFHC